MLSVISRCVDNEMVFLQKKHGFQLGEEKNLEVRYLSGEDTKRIAWGRCITKHKERVVLPKLIISN